MSPCNCYWMCIKYPAEIFIEIRVCLRLSRSPGPSGSHYHSYHGSQSRIKQIKHSPTASSCHQQSGKNTRLGLFVCFDDEFYPQVIILLWLGGACGSPEWLSARIKDAGIWGNRRPVFRCLPLVHGSHDDSFSVSVWTWSLRTVGNVLSRALKARTKNWKKRKEHRHKKVTLEIQEIWIQTLD